MKINGRIDKDLIKGIIRKRPEDAHKGSCGKVLLVAGGAGMTGAAVLAARAALRCGSGLVYVCTPRANFTVIQTLCPEAICIEWQDASRDLGIYDAIAFGPGMGVSASTKDKLRTILLGCACPLVIDADGLNQVSADDGLKEHLREYRGEVMLTPHLVEAKRLAPEAHAEGGQDEDARMPLLECLIDLYGALSLVKGPGTLVGRQISKAEGGIEVWQNTTGNPGMATAGSGDVLTGSIVSFAGQGMSMWDAARAGVYIHGLAGDLAAADKGEYGVIAGDIAEQLAYAIKSIFE